MFLRTDQKHSIRCAGAGLVPVRNPNGQRVGSVGAYTLVADGHKTRPCKVVERRCEMKTHTNQYRPFFVLSILIVGNEEWAKVIAGEVFSCALDDFSRLRNTNIPSYLFVMVRNRSIDHVRR